MKPSIAPAISRTSSNLSKLIGISSYVLVWLLLLNTYQLFSNCHEWVDDFWHHSAIINILMRSPFPVTNPFTGHPPAIVPYWPYHFTISQFALIFHLPAQIALANAGYFNLVFFAVAFWGFVTRISKNELAPFISIVACLLVWGENPWNYSGFIHLNLLLYTLSYPSTFAIAATLLCACLLFDFFRDNQLTCAVLSCSLAIVIILIHPLTFLFLGSLLVGIAIHSFPTTPHKVLTIVPILVTIALASAWLWPFLPLSEILSNDYYKSDPNASLMYTKLVSRILPSLLGIIALGIKVYRNRRDVLFWAFAALIPIYTYGFLSNSWNYGRVIAFIVLIFHVALGCLISELLSSDFIPRLSRKILPFILVVIGIVALGAKFPSMFRAVNERCANSVYSRLSPIMSKVPPGSFVLANSQNSQYVVAFGAPVLAFNVPPFFREEFEERTQIQSEFFSIQAGGPERLHIAQMLSAAYVLLEKLLNVPVDKIVVDLKTAYSIEYEDDRFILLRSDSSK